jgi:hypothetical protein
LSETESHVSVAWMGGGQIKDGKSIRQSVAWAVRR